MPALERHDVTGEIVWIGRTQDRSVTLRSEVTTAAELTFDGMVGEDHGHATRPSCGRVTGLYPRGTEIRNTRQLSVVAEEDLAAIAADMGVDRLDPADIGASIVVRGIPDFSFLTPSSRLQAPSGATLTVDMENRPCHLPAAPLDQSHPGAGTGFKTAAKGRRGITAWVERPGSIALGDLLTLFVPAQRAWEGLGRLI
ncbi:MAG: MOSC domain-containing protein [Pseudomonadota bacterium]